MRLDSGLLVSPTRLYVPGVGKFGQEDPLLCLAIRADTEADAMGAYGQVDYVYRFLAAVREGFFQVYPEAYVEMMHPYGFVASQATGKVDPDGLKWFIDRTRGRKAVAVGERGDKISDLSKSGVNDPSRTTFLDEVPNTVLMAWMGELGWFGRRWVHWGNNRRQIGQEGFAVAEWNLRRPRGSIKRDLLRKLHVMTNKKELVGWFSWSHGSRMGLHGPYMTSARDRFDNLYIPYTDIQSHLEYGLGKVVVHACYADHGRPYFLKGNPNGKYHGKSGEWNPVSPRPSNWGGNWDRIMK
jgi:hypothetical protein